MGKDYCNHSNVIKKRLILKNLWCKIKYNLTVKKGKEIIIIIIFLTLHSPCYFFET